MIRGTWPLDRGIFETVLNNTVGALPAAGSNVMWECGSMRLCQTWSDRNCHCRSFVATLDNARAIIFPMSQMVRPEMSKRKGRQEYENEKMRKCESEEMGKCTASLSHFLNSALSQSHISTFSHFIVSPDSRSESVLQMPVGEWGIVRLVSNSVRPKLSPPADIPRNVVTAALQMPVGIAAGYCQSARVCQSAEKRK